MILVSLASIILGVHIAFTEEFISRTGHLATGKVAIGTGIFFVSLGLIIAFFAIKGLFSIKS